MWHQDISTEEDYRYNYVISGNTVIGGMTPLLPDASIKGRDRMDTYARSLTSAACALFRQALNCLVRSWICSALHVSCVPGMTWISTFSVSVSSTLPHHNLRPSGFSRAKKYVILSEYGRGL